MIKVGIIGGAGYTAGELIRILIAHPHVKLDSVVSKSHFGESLYTAHPDLEGVTDLLFTDKLSNNIDVVFLCTGHGRTQQVLEAGLIPDNTKIIDLSNEFRIENDNHNYVYGLPELNKNRIKKAHNVANPGCFATLIELSLLPLAKNNLLKSDVHFTAITGSTGAGQKPSDTTHFSWRANNASIYKALKHQHIDEIKQCVQQLQISFDKKIHMIPVRGAFTRGILSAGYLKCDKSAKEVRDIFEEYYKNEPFVQITSTNPDVKRVANTNKVILHIQKEDDLILVTGAIDNLLKGASGQAVQNMNLMFGMDETMGLNFKASAF